jgi:uncharacterized protein YdhG (YjbR/CyaY superfamily)
VATKTTKKSSPKAKFDGFSATERALMKERAKELKAEAAKADLEKGVLAAIAQMTGNDRKLGERIHAIVKAAAPELGCKTWYGMPAYTKDGKVVCFFKPAVKFESRYATLGFEDAANIDDGTMWATSFALTKLTPAEEAKITKLVKKAVK